MKVIKFFIAIILVCLIVGCGDNQKVEIEAYLNKVEKIVLEWDDANQLAKNTSRINLPHRIAELQEIKRKVINLTVPSDALEANKALISYMDAVITLYIEFLDTENSDEHIQMLFIKVDRLCNEWLDATTTLILKLE